MRPDGCVQRYECQQNLIVQVASTDGNTELVSLSYQCQWVAQQDEARGVVGQVIADLLEARVYCLVFVLTDLFGVPIDHVCARAKEGEVSRYRTKAW